MGPYYHRFATAGTDKLKAGPAGTHLSFLRLVITADAQLTLTLDDGVQSKVIDARPGVNHFHYELPFATDKDVTLTVTGGNASVFGDVIFH